MEDAIIIFIRVNFHDAQTLNQVKSMPRRLEDVLSRAGNPYKY
jgi:hypothetical protein